MLSQRRSNVHPQWFTLFLLLAALSATAVGQELDWRSDYNAARKDSLEKNRPMLLDFVTDNCYWCKQLDLTTFRDPRVAAMLQQKFVLLKVDADRSPRLAQMLKVQAYPTLIIASSDGQILTYVEGYIEAPKLLAHLQKAAGASGGNAAAAPDLIARNFQDAEKALKAGDFAKAIPLFRTVADDAKDSALQAKAKLALQGVEQQAMSRLARARLLEDRGQSLDAADVLADLIRQYAGAAVVAEARALWTSISARPEIKDRQRQRRARELLAQAREEYHLQQYAGCLEKCELLAATYTDLTEGAEAARLAADIKADPEMMTKVCSSLSERLIQAYLSLAEAHLKKGNQEHALACLERIQKEFPGTTYAQVAQVKLKELQGRPALQTDFKKQP